ncbi:MAG: hypothetical protein ACTTHG_07825 [Treponemataceae bacterium]
MILKQADELIEHQNLNDALALLQNYITENPEEFDDIQRRIQKIYTIREEYAKKAKILVALIEKECKSTQELNENYQKQLNIIAELESMEKNPTATTEKFIRQAKTAAQFTLYKAKYNEIMATGSKLTIEHNFDKAIQVFYSGLDLYQKEFFEKDYGKEVTKKIQTDLEDLEKLVNISNSQITDLKNKYDLFQQELKGKNSQKINNTYKNFQTSIEKLSNTRNSIAKIGWDFKNTYNDLQKIDDELTDASFLPLAFRFILGDKKTLHSGIIASFELQWELTIPKAKTSISSAIEQTMLQAVNSLNSKDLLLNKNFSETDKHLNQVKQYILLGQNIENLYELKKNPEKTSQKTADSNFLNTLDSYNKFVEYVENSETTLLSLINLNFETDKMEKRNPKTDIEKNDLYHSNLLLDNINRYNQIIQKTLPVKSELKELEGISVFNEVLKRINTNALTKKIIQLENLASYYHEGCFFIFQNYQNSNNEAKKLFDTKYPSEALATIEKRFENINDDKNKIQQRINELDKNAADMSKKNSPEYFVNKKHMEDYLEKLSTLALQADVIAKKAKDEIQIAELAKYYAVENIAKVKANMKAEEFENSLRNLEEARIKYAESLAHQESKTLRSSSEKEINDLLAEISTRQKEVVVRKVRNLTTNAKEALDNGNFEKAESLLIQAESLWSNVYLEENEEIIILVELIENAMRVNTGREIPQNDPRYDTMSGFLEIAVKNFNEGAVFAKKGEKEKALEFFEEAGSYIESVKKEFPRNKDARVLSLKIKQLTLDKNAFDKLFEANLQSIKEKHIEYRNDKNKLQEAYIELGDLEGVNPKYPGLLAEKDNLEQDLGIKAQRKDEKDLMYAKNFTAKAYDLFNRSKDNSTLSSALKLVNQALKLDPNNKSAQLLKDKINIIKKTETHLLLSEESLEKYNKALYLFNSGDIFGAQDLINELLTVQENKKTPKILKLQKQINERIGVDQ